MFVTAALVHSHDLLFRVIYPDRVMTLRCYPKADRGKINTFSPSIDRLPHV